MIIVRNKKKLILHTARHAEVIDIIPHAKVFEHDGKTLTALEHGVEESLVLRNMGFKKTPPPILSYYKWPARFAAMEHQRQTAAFFTSNRRALCLNEPGTGKSIAALWAADYLIDEGLAKKVLIVAPLSTLKVVWGKELRHHFSHRSFELLIGDKATRLRKLKTPGVQFFVINHDGFGIVRSELDDIDVVIYDEATALKTPSSQRFKQFFVWMNTRDRWLWMLTGTPISQSPVDAWTLARLVGNASVSKSFSSFKDLVMAKVSTFRWVARPEAIAICKQVLQPSIRYSLDECKELPETVFLDHECPMSAEQVTAFKEMRERAVLMAHDVSAPNVAVVFSKLVQICCGVVYGNDGERVRLDFTGRYDKLKDVMEEIGISSGANTPSEKVIVFVPLRGIQERLQEMLTADGYDVVSVNGSVSGSARDKIFDEFQNGSGIKVLLAHPQVAAHGLTLTRARDIIWYAPIYSLEQYEQANARIRRLGTEGKTRVHHLWSTGFEKELYSRLQHKRRVLGEFLELVSGVNEV